MENNINPEEYQAIPPQWPQYPPKKPNLPGAVATLILGIVSLAYMAFLGWIPALIAMNLFKKDMATLEANPDQYSPSSISMAQAGKKMADVGLILGILGMFVTALYYYWIFSMSFHHHSYDPYNF